jgi:demethylmenaquinone methyltransferase/2-methoxy-6-polyprenyl-1,4-benzoquinol methylase
VALKASPQKSVLPDLEHKRDAVKSMFDRIAPRYDLLNRMMSLGLDQRWRRRALDEIEVGAGDVVVDLACGTGDLTELAVARGARVVGVDFAREMLRGARRRGIAANFVQGDGAALPFASGSASVALCGFALRNFVALPDIFAELARIIAPGGRIALIEVDRPSSAIVRLGHSVYFDRLVPLLGALISDREAYTYLPQSTAYLPPDDELRALLEKAGFTALRKERLFLGAAQILFGVRA